MVNYNSKSPKKDGWRNENDNSMSGHAKLDMIEDEIIRDQVGIALSENKMREAKLR